jgi:hypothetical protein
LEGIPSNFVRFRNRSTLHVNQAITCLQSIRFRYGIPEIESRRNWKEFPGIPSDSGLFRNRSTLPVHQAINCLQSIRFRYGIPGIESRRNWKDFPGIPSDSGRFRNCTISHVLSSPLTLTLITRWVRDDTIIMEVVIPESYGIRRNSHRFPPFPTDSGFTQFRNCRPESDHH